MPVSYHHGVRVLEVTGGVRALRAVATSIIGMVCTGPAADEDVFPLNTPVLVTDIATALTKAGDDGTLPLALQSISDQTSPIIVVVRVEIGVDDAETATNVIGSGAGPRTGLQALLNAETLVGVRPRIIGAPGLDAPTVATAIQTLAPKLRAFAYVRAGAADTVAEAITYRDTLSGREMMIVYPDWTAWPGAAVATAMGLRAKLDEEVGWHKTISNVPVLGVSGINLPVTWDLQDPSTDAGLLNAAQVTTLIRRNGYRFWGSRTCAEEVEYQFESAVRTAQVLRDTVAEGVLAFVDKPLHPSLARDIIETINADFRQLINGGYIIGGSAWLNDQLNTQEALAAGALQIDYDFTPCPPLENLLLRQRITDRYLNDFASRVNFAA